MTRGGHRPGAGRPRTTGPSPRVLVVMTADIRDRLDAVRDPGESRSAAILEAVRRLIEQRERDR